jgi:hypothetical protein
MLTRSSNNRDFYVLDRYIRPSEYLPEYDAIDTLERRQRFLPSDRMHARRGNYGTRRPVELGDMSVRKMSRFNPSRRCLVHDCVNNAWVRWRPVKDLKSYRKHAVAAGGLVLWHGMCLDGWLPVAMPRRRRRAISKA